MSRLRRGFTLVELLVVIAIIGMLAALLLPAIQGARARARQTQCLNNMKNVVTAILNYESAKQKFPPSYSYYEEDTEFFYGWVPKLLVNLGRNDLYELYTNPAPGNQLASAQTRVDVLVCPSAPPTNASAPLNYVLNCGRQDVSTGSNPPDWQENGVFFSELKIGNAPPVRPSSIGYVSRYDGTSNTLMVSENINALQPGPFNGNWTTAESIPSCWESGSFGESMAGILWWTAPTVELNKLADVYPAAGDINFARPSSAHTTGFNAGFCDGSVRILNDDIQYRVYALIMTPRGSHSKDPGTSPGTPTNYPNTWKTGAVLTPLSDSDLN